jgi:GNAT superfamily N-acetyltransferase
VHHVHAASMPELAPYVSDAETWAEHRPLYVELFEKPETTLLLGIADVIIGALPGNIDAIRLYERRGFRPTWMYLSRFAGR